MASAPKPGVGARIAAADELDQALGQKVTIGRKGADPLTFSFGDLGPRDDMACRKATGWNVAELVGVEQVSGFEVLAIWWLARRHNGEPDLTFDEVLDEFPTNAEIIAAGFSSVEVESDDGEGDSPEG